MPRGTIKATVLIETILAAFEMDEILYELREHSAGLNAGRWDYIFSVIKKLGHRPEFVLPDRSEVTMAVPFMRAYCELLVQDLPPPRRARDGRHGGLHPVAARPRGERGRARRRCARTRSARPSQGFDGTWVAHPDLVPVAREAFDAVLGDRPNQIDRQRDDVRVDAADLLDVAATPGEITERGLRNNVAVGIQYIAAWLRRLGRRRDQQPDGGRGHGGDLALAGLAVAPPRPGVGRDACARLIEEEAARLGAGYEEARELFERGRDQPRLRRVPDAARVRPPRRLTPAAGVQGVEGPVIVSCVAPDGVLLFPAVSTLTAVTP